MPDSITSRIPRRLARFCVVGASGVAVNMGILILLTEKLRLPYAISSLVAIEISILTNFALNNAWTWSDRRSESLLRRIIKYHAVAGLTALAANWCVLVALTRFAGLDYRISNLIGIAVGVALNFVLNHVWTFGQAESTKSSADGDMRASLTSSTESSASNAEQRNDAVNGPGRGQARNRLLWAVIAAVTILTAAKVYLAGHAELLPEEAYYWSYLQHPALGYFDHPPMVAWVVGVGTTLLGDTELGVRLGTILLSLGSTLLLFLLARLWFGATVACWAALAFNALPIFIGVGVLAFPDGPLVFFWLLTLYAVSKAIGIGPERIPVEEMPGMARARATSFWLLAGIAFGGALLSKYTAVLLGASLGLFLLISSAHRHWLRRPQPWLAGIVALLVFSPVIIWNVEHEWASFLFQSTRTVGQEPEVLKNVATFWLFQLVVLGPLLVVFAIAVWQGVERGWLRREDRWNFAVSFSLPLFLIFVLASFKTEVHLNWTAPCFLSLLPAVAAIFRDGTENKLRFSASRWRCFGWAVAVLAVCVVGFAFSLTVWGVPSAMTSSRSGGWREIAARVRAQEAELARSTGQKPFVIGADKYNLSALLGFYNRAPHNHVNNLAFGKHGLAFRYWTDLKSFEGRPAVVVETRLNAGSLRNLTNHFDRVAAAKRVVIPTFGTRTRTVWLIDCYGYRLSPKAPQHTAVGTNRSSLNMR